VDKRKRSYDLNKVKSLVSEGKCDSTKTAISTAHSLGFSETEMYDSILLLEPKDFEKSTTENYNNKVFQDVYKKVLRSVHVYIKLKIIQRDADTVLVMSFKRDTSIS